MKNTGEKTLLIRKYEKEMNGYVLFSFISLCCSILFPILYILTVLNSIKVLATATDLVVITLLAITGVVLSVFWMTKAGRSELVQESAYSDYLSTLDINLLKRASESPELDQYSRKLIIRFLNDQHPNWSLEPS